MYFEVSDGIFQYSIANSHFRKDSLHKVASCRVPRRTGLSQHITDQLALSATSSLTAADLIDR